MQAIPELHSENLTYLLSLDNIELIRYINEIFTSDLKDKFKIAYSFLANTRNIKNQKDIKEILKTDCRLVAKLLDQKACSYTTTKTEFAKELKKIRNRKIVLIEKFKKRHSFVPRIINDIALIEMNENDIVNNFKFKEIKILLNDQFFLNMNEYRTVDLYLKTKGLYNKLDSNFVDYVYEHNLENTKTFLWLCKNIKRNFSQRTCYELINKSKTVDILLEKYNTIQEIFRELNAQKAETEMRLIEEKYNFKFNECIFDIPMTSVEENEYVAEVMQPGDYRMATIGYDSYCCQHLNGAGETAMMYGLLAPKAGFWIIRKGNKIIAQAEIWEGKIQNTEVLVFDNIEYADNRTINNIMPILIKWLEASPYKNIAMGLGYNETPSKNMKPIKDRIHQPAVKKLKDVYTDTTTCVWLKQNGIIFRKAA